jgi:5-methylcytosine-specific restriction endonuclease McrA
MAAYHPHLPAAEVHASLRRSLEELRAAERNAVLWFAEILSRKLYRELGYGSIQQYAAVALGFSRSKTAQFLRLVRALEALPVLRASLEKGEVSWTKAREVVKVATPRTEAAWVKEARASSRRQLEKRVATARGRAKAARTGDRRQVALEAGEAQEESGGAVAGRVPAEIPVDVHARFSPEQYARYEALLETLRKKGQKGSREELLLAGLEALAVHAAPDRRADRPMMAGRQGVGEPASEDPTPCTRVHSTPPHQVVVQVCERCGEGEVVTSRGPKPLAPATLRAILCDTRVHRPGERNRASIPPSVRRGVMARDQYRCRGAGCNSARFLSVHHVIPREAGGTNDPDNLITLCGNCHRAVHRHGRHGEVFRKAG